MLQDALAMLAESCGSVSIPRPGTIQESISNVLFLYIYIYIYISSTERSSQSTIVLVCVFSDSGLFAKYSKFLPFPQDGLDHEESGGNDRPQLLVSEGLRPGMQILIILENNGLR